MLHRRTDFTVRIGKYGTDVVQGGPEVVDDDERDAVAFVPFHRDAFAGNHDRPVEELIVEQFDVLIRDDDRTPSAAFGADENFIEQFVVEFRKPADDDRDRAFVAGPSTDVLILTSL